jgi:putative transposase
MHWKDRAHRRRALNVPAHAHELTFTCQNRYAFLAAERTCNWLAEAIDAARNALDFALWAYVFMPEHVHLIVFPRQPKYDMRLILKRIKEPVGRLAIRFMEEHAPEWLPRITVEKGSRKERRFWLAGGGYDRNITELRTLSFMIDYVHNNPVRRGLVGQASDWKWSSAGWAEGCPKNILAPDEINWDLM